MSSQTTAHYSYSQNEVERIAGMSVTAIRIMQFAWSTYADGLEVHSSLYIA